MQNSFNFLPESPPGMLIIQPETEKLSRTSRAARWMGIKYEGMRWTARINIANEIAVNYGCQLCVFPLPAY